MSTWLPRPEPKGSSLLVAGALLPGAPLLRLLVVLLGDRLPGAVGRGGRFGDGDGRLDILSAIAASPSTQSILSTRIQAPTAPGTFADPVRSATGANPVAVVVGDLNGDGLPDVAVADAAAAPDGSPAVDVQFQVVGTPGAFSAPVALPLGTRDAAAAWPLEDLDGDGRLDMVVVAAAGGGDVLVLFQQAPGSFCVRHGDSPPGESPPPWPPPGSPARAARTSS